MKKFILFIKINFTFPFLLSSKQKAGALPHLLLELSFLWPAWKIFLLFPERRARRNLKVLTITSRDPLEADPDRNGFSNFAEYALGMIPTEPSTLQRPWLRVEPDRSVSLFIPRARWLPEGIEFEVFCSEDLREWVPINRSPSVENLSETQDLLRYSVGSAEGKRFYWIVIQSRE